MTLDARTLATGPGWYVQDVTCTAGPQDRPFEERHDTVSLAAVMGGTFQYRTAQGSALLAPGAVLLGNHGHCFECGHEHGVGDRCLSFHFTPAYWEDVVATVPGARKATFTTPCLPPAASLIPIIAALAAARELAGPALEEVALDFAGAVLTAAAGSSRPPRTPSTRDERRISAAVRRIEATAHEPDGDALSVARLARDAGLSPYHFLRVFRTLVGMTPHQYVLRTRINRAATQLRLSDRPVSEIAFEAGFNDLSTFNRRFRGLMGTPPRAYRRQRDRTTPIAYKPFAISISSNDTRRLGKAT